MKLLLKSFVLLSLGAVVISCTDNDEIVETDQGIIEFGDIKGTGGDDDIDWDILDPGNYDRTPKEENNKDKENKKG
ncbi:hypothetical protein [Aureivirga marina]|uniref:hypothetical protein n=1 Tax=Aureivirga marina TaxID=1182451 RepID=UPI0018CAC122|nr:hypothetical protein [Aureivirga marina]